MPRMTRPNLWAIIAIIILAGVMVLLITGLS